MSLFRPAACAVAILALSATAAFAHPKLVSSTPASGATVASTNKIELHFSESLMPKLSGADVTSTKMAMGGGPMMDHVMKIDGKAAVDPKDKKTLVVTLSSKLDPGVYKVDWHAVSTDTHRLANSFTFTVK